MKKRTYPRPCTECGLVLSEDGFYIKYKATGARFSRCTACHNKRTLANLIIRHDADPTAFNAQRRARYAAKPDQYRAGHRDWYAQNAEHERERQRTWRQTNIEKARTTGRLADARRAQSKRIYRQQHHDHYLALGAARRFLKRDDLRKQGRHYYQTHKARYKVNLALRRARYCNAPGEWTTEQWEVLLERYAHRCLSCGTLSNLTPDHVVPLSRGGSNNIENIQPLCRTCNTAKNAKTIDYRPQ